MNPGIPRFASARARELAAELDVDVAGVEGSGRGGAVTAGDVRAAARVEPPEEGFGPAGLRLWGEVAEGLTLRADELAILAQACRTRDAIATLEASVPAGSPVVPGSKGQDVLHPAIPELRLQRQLLATLLGRLDLPESEGEGIEGEWDGLTASSRARKAALAKWHKKVA